MAEKTEGVDAGEIIEKATEAGREYARSLSAAAVAGLGSAFDLQNKGIELWAQSVRAGQAQTTKVAEASVQLIERTFETK